MFTTPVWDLDESKILTRRELAAVLQAPARTANQRRNRIIVRLACCCGLRVSEIAALRMDDVIVGVPRPHLRLRRETTKGKRPRNVPLWWDAGTLAELREWKAQRAADGAGDHDPFVCSVQSNRYGESLQRAAIR
jgi:integrase